MEPSTELDQRNIKTMDVIDKLKSLGSLHHIDFPQLVVCGDQSSGKSSVLEAICGMQFPIDEDICTRYPTEFVMRQGKVWTLTATIRPAPDRNLKEQAQLQVFRKETQAYTTLNKDICRAFVDAVKEAGEVMGIGSGAKHFAHDILCIQLTGRSLTPLTLVDLPGVFHGRAKNQTVADAKNVKSLVLDYMKQKRTVNLVIISASSDLSNQEVTDFVDHVDPNGERSMGIITKPDTICGAKQIASYHELLANTTIPYKLGWHVLMNRSHDKQNTTKLERDQAEAEFLAQGPWEKIPAEQKGIGSLLERLTTLLDNAIVTALPDVVNECEALIADVEAELRQLNSSSGRGSRDLGELFDLSEKFTSLLTSALKGDYDDMMVLDKLDSQYHHQQLLSAVEDLIDRFQGELRHNGHSLKVVDTPTIPDDADNLKAISHKDFVTRVAQRKKEKGLGGVSGQLNRRLISDLFYEQSVSWLSIVENFVESLLEASQKCCISILDTVTTETSRQKIADLIITPALESHQASLRAYMHHVMGSQQRRELLNLNKRITDRIPHGRNRETIKVLHEVLEDHSRRDGSLSGTFLRNSHFPRGSLDNEAITKFTQDFASRLQIDRSDSSEAIECMEAVYKVSSSRPTFPYLRLTYVTGAARGACAEVQL